MLREIQNKLNMPDFKSKEKVIIKVFKGGAGKRKEAVNGFVELSVTVGPQPHRAPPLSKLSNQTGPTRLAPIWSLHGQGEEPQLVGAMLRLEELWLGQAASP